MTFADVKSKKSRIDISKIFRWLHTPCEREQTMPSDIQATETNVAALRREMEKASNTYAVTLSCNDMALVNAARIKSR